MANRRSPRLLLRISRVFGPFCLAYEDKPGPSCGFIAECPCYRYKALSLSRLRKFLQPKMAPTFFFSNHLRKIGLYSAEPRQGNANSWHMDDLDRFLAKGLALAVPLPESPRHSVTLADVMRLKLRNATAKGDIVAALFDGRLAVVGRESETFSGLILNKNEIDAFVLQKRIAVEENSYSAAEAAKRTGLDLMAIANAINLGLLTGETKNSRLRVSVESVEQFNSEYLPLSRLAPTLNTLAQHLLRKCHRHGITVIQVPRSNVGSNQPILPRASEAQLLNIWRTESLAHKSPPCDRQLTYAEALKTYLESLQREGKPLPRRAGFPNKAAIAKACKFGRDVLYDYPVVIQLLDDFGRAEGTPTEDSGAIPSGENLNLSSRGQCLLSTEYNVHEKFGMARNEEELSIQA